MRKRKKKANKLISRPSKLTYLPIVFILVVVLILSCGSFVLSNRQDFNVNAESKDLSLTNPIAQVLSEIFNPNKTVVSEITEAEKLALELERSTREAKENKINDLKNYLLQKGSVGFANSAKVIIESSEKCGVDYKLMVSIAGYESGYGKKPVKKYNPFGWLNGVNYNSWDEAVSDIICDFGKMYSDKGLKDPHQIVKIYVGPSGNKENWANTVSALMKKVP